MVKRSENINRKDADWLTSWQPQLIQQTKAKDAYAFQTQLLKSQAESSKNIARLSHKQALALLSHCIRQVPFYKDYAQHVNPSLLANNSRLWSRLPIIGRDELLAHGKAFRARQLPPGHRQLSVLRSSGSTGTPVEVVSTNISNSWQKAFALRSAIWARQDFAKTLGVIRKFSQPATCLPDGETTKHWADPEGIPFNTGQRFGLEATEGSIEQQLDWIGRKRPDYLMTYPSVLRELCALSQKQKDAWRPLGLTTLGETVDDDLREQVRETWHREIHDVYSAEETGVIAIQCPSHGRYHIQSEAVFVEIVDDAGRACRPGKEGRVVITTLSNYATPLIRYAIGDRAIAGASCLCGRNSPVLTKILGRERNLLVTEQGKFWPSFGTRRFRKIAPITTQVFRQTALDALEMQYVSSEPLTGAQEHQLSQLIADALPHSMTIQLKRVDAIHRAASGKSEIFTSDVTAT